MSCELLVVACGTLLPDQGLKSGPLHGERGVPVPRPPRNSRWILKARQRGWTLSYLLPKEERGVKGVSS